VRNQKLKAYVLFNRKCKDALKFLNNMIYRTEEDIQIKGTLDYSRLVPKSEWDYPENLFRFLDHKALEYGFEKLNASERYLYIQLIKTDKSCQLISNSKFIDEKIKVNLSKLFRNGNPLFSQIAKLLLLPIVSNNFYQFNNSIKLTNSAKVLLIGSHFVDEMRGGLFIAPQLGIIRIQSFLKLFGIEVDIYDSRVDKLDKLCLMVKRNNYNIIGFNILHPPIDSLNLCNKIRELAPKAFFIAGGQGAAFNHSFILENSTINAVAIGFGEYTLLDIIMNNGPEIKLSSLEQIKGLYIKIRNKEISFTGNVNAYSQDDIRFFSLCINFNDIDYPLYWGKVKDNYSENHLKLMKAQNTTKTIRIYTETHCPMKCDFCSSTNWIIRRKPCH